MSYPAIGSQETQMIRPCQKFQGHFGRVYDVAHLPGAQLMTCSSDGSLRLWNSESGEQIGDDWRDRRFDIMETIALSPDGKKVVSGSGEGGMRLWDLDSGKLITKWMGHTKRVTSVCWNRDSGRLLSGSLDGTARMWDAESGETVLGPIETGLFAMFVAIYSPDETMIGTGGREFEGNELEDSASIKIWDAQTGTLISKLKGRIGAVYCLAWTVSGTLISGSEDSSIRTWNTTTWQQIAVLAKHNDVVFDIAIFPNGRILASASLDKTARLWNLENGQPIGIPLRHADVVECVSFSVDGRLIATGCRDKNAYTWDVYAIVREAGLEVLLTVRFLESRTSHHSKMLRTEHIIQVGHDKSFLDVRDIKPPHPFLNPRVLGRCYRTET
jgi:WD40 repeat protein